MSKHTPGPWRLSTGNVGNGIEGFSGKALFEGDDGYRMVALYMHCEPTGLYANEEANRKANANLIAAAPDLLAACVEFVRKVDAGEAKSTRSYEQMKAAIAKATGEA